MRSFMILESSGFILGICSFMILDKILLRPTIKKKFFLICFLREYATKVEFGLISAHLCLCQWVTCAIHGTHKLSNSVKFSLKLGSTALFTHLKIILLQYF